ncbi:MAG TPA: hypothetical protein PK364_02605 [Synergistaceae bacterium]|nr:hypothetical protein [Synergistaceae bacterium]HPJ26076.1 hypothetical protein [Synergistaceae bacterium]HPQ37565.1 hypothetical protein [Synergistaceae bacterium]
MARERRFVAGYPSGKSVVSKEAEALSFDFYGAAPEQKEKEVLEIAWRGPFEGYR